MFFLFSFIITLSLLYFIGDPVNRQWVPYGTMGIVFFGSWALVHTQRFVRAIPLVSTLVSLFFALLFTEEEFVRFAIAVATGFLVWIWWRHAAARAPAPDNERAILSLFFLLFLTTVLLSTFSFALFLATPLWQLWLVVFMSVWMFTGGAFVLTHMKPWFLSSVAVALFTSELFLILHALPISILVKTAIGTLIIALVVHLGDRMQHKKILTPRYVRTTAGIVILSISTLLATATWL